MLYNVLMNVRNKNETKFITYDYEPKTYTNTKHQN